MPLMMLNKFQMIDDIGFDDIGVRSIPSMGSGGWGWGCTSSPPSRNFFVTLETLGVIEIKLWSSK